TGSDIKRVGPESRGTTRLAGRVPNEEGDALAGQGVRELDLTDPHGRRGSLGGCDTEGQEESYERRDTDHATRQGLQGCGAAVGRSSARETASVARVRELLDLPDLDYGDARRRE